MSRTGQLESEESDMKIKMRPTFQDWDETELSIISESDSIDRLLEKEGFKLENVPKFDPDEIVHLDKSGKPYKTDPIKKFLSSVDDELEAQRKTYERLRRRRKKEYEEEQARAKRSNKFKAKPVEKPVDTSVVNTPSVSNVLTLDERKMLRFAGKAIEEAHEKEKQRELRQKELKDFGEGFMMKWGIPQDEQGNQTRTVTQEDVYSVYISEKYDLMFAIAKITVSDEITFICLVIDDRVFVPAQIVSPYKYGEFYMEERQMPFREKRTAFHEFLEIYNYFEEYLKRYILYLQDNPTAELMKIAEFIRDTEKSILEEMGVFGQPILLDEKFYPIIKHKGGVSAFVNGANYCKNHICDVCPFQRYCACIMNIYDDMLAGAVYKIKPLNQWL